MAAIYRAPTRAPPAQGKAGEGPSEHWALGGRQCIWLPRLSSLAWLQPRLTHIFLLSLPPPPKLQEVARQHYLRQLLGCWRAAAVESKEERAVALRGAITSQLLLLRRGCWAWRTAVEEERRQAAGLELAQQHDRRKLLVSAWLGWGKWTLACHGMGQRHAARLLGTALLAWRSAAKSAEKRCAIPGLLQATAICCWPSSHLPTSR